MDDSMGAVGGPAGNRAAADRRDTPCPPAGGPEEPPAVTVSAGATTARPLEEGAGTRV